MKHRKLLILGVVGVAVLALFASGIALGGFLFQKQLTGTVTIVPSGDISVMANLAMGTLSTGDNVTRAVTVRNDSQSPVMVAAGNLLGSDSSIVATVTWPLIGQTIQPGDEATEDCTFTIADVQTQWDEVNVTWTVSGVTP